MYFLIPLVKPHQVWCQGGDSDSDEDDGGPGDWVSFDDPLSIPHFGMSADAFDRTCICMKEWRKRICLENGGDEITCVSCNPNREWGMSQL